MSRHKSTDPSKDAAFLATLREAVNIADRAVQKLAEGSQKRKPRNAKTKRAGSAVRKR